MSVLSTIGSYVVARLGEASTYSGISAIALAVVSHQGTAAIIAAVGGFLAVVLPASIINPIRAALAPK